VSGLVADTSVWIDFLGGRRVPALEEGLARGAVWVPPLVVSELVSGARRPRDRTALIDLLRDLPVCETPLDHWVRVGELRRRMAERGVAVATPDAHVAQCALDLTAVLLTRDAVFTRMAGPAGLQVREGTD